MRDFFPMHRGELRYLLLLVVFSIVSFLPWWREIHVAGMAVFGWLMAALMVLSPAVALYLIVKGRRP